MHKVSAMWSTEHRCEMETAIFFFFPFLKRISIVDCHSSSQMLARNCSPSKSPNNPLLVSHTQIEWCTGHLVLLRVEKWKIEWEKKHALTICWWTGQHQFIDLPSQSTPIILVTNVQTRCGFLIWALDSESLTRNPTTTKIRRNITKRTSKKPNRKEKKQRRREKKNRSKARKEKSGWL